MGTLLLVDGPDRAGKSSLIDDLVRRQPQQHWIVVRNRTPPRGTEVDTHSWVRQQYRDLYHLAYMNVAYGPGLNVVMDRCHVSEAVYGTLFRDTPEAWRILDETLPAAEDVRQWLLRSARLVVLTGDPEALWAREDGESQEKSLPQVAGTCTAFENALEASPFQHRLLLDTRGKTRHRVYENAAAWLSLQNELRSTDLSPPQEATA